MDRGSRYRWSLRSSWLPLALLCLATCGCVDDGGGDPTVNPHNALLSGPWILVPPETQIETNPPCYLVFDGEGTVTDWGVFGPGSPAGTYSMNADSSGTMHLGTEHDPAVDCAVKLTSGTTGHITATGEGEEEHATIEKVVDPGLMSGLWTGQIHALARNISCTMQIDQQGVVTTLTGLAGPVAGRAYAHSSGLAVAFLRTAETDAFGQVHLHTGSVVGETWSGALGVDQNGGDGTFSFSRQ